MPQVFYNCSSEDVPKETQDGLLKLVEDLMHFYVQRKADNQMLICSFVSFIITLAANVPNARKDIADGLRKAIYIIEEM